jgi:poly(A) polymerase
MVFKKLIKGVKNIINSERPSTTELKRRILTRSEHSISRKKIAKSALDVMYHLRRSGHESYLVGGGVRDLLLGEQPKDFDIATDATPEQVKSTFRNCRIVGRRFRIAHVFFGREIIEVSTFRAHHGNKKSSDQGMVLRDNVFGSIEEDAARRDFTINALYYNINDFSVLDFVGGLEDIKTRTLRLIGKPEERYSEDPVRMLRAVRLAVKLNLNIEEKTAQPILKLSKHLSDVPAARLWDEAAKLFLSGYAQQTFEQLEAFGLLQEMFAGVFEYWQQDEKYQSLIQQALINTDNRIQEGKSINPAFMFAVWLYPLFEHLKNEAAEESATPQDAFNHAFYTSVGIQNKRITIPKRFSMVIREIWWLQNQFLKRTPKRVAKLLEQKRFRAAYDFLVLRANAGLASKDDAQWWTDYQDKDTKGQEAMSNALLNTPKSKSGKKRPYRNKKSKPKNIQD